MPWRPGMIDQGADRMDLDLSKSWVIGDAPRDIEAGKLAGCRTILFHDSSPRNLRHKRRRNRTCNLISKSRHCPKRWISSKERTFLLLPSPRPPPHPRPPLLKFPRQLKRSRANRLQPMRTRIEDKKLDFCGKSRVRAGTFPTRPPRHRRCRRCYAGAYTKRVIPAMAESLGPLLTSAWSPKPLALHRRGRMKRQNRQNRR